MSKLPFTQMMSGPESRCILMILLPHFGDSLMWSRAGVTLPGLLSFVMAPHISIQSWGYTGVSSPAILLPLGCLCVSATLPFGPPGVCVCVCVCVCVACVALSRQHHRVRALPPRGAPPSGREGPHLRFNPSVTRPPLCSVEKPFSLIHPSLSHQRPHSLDGWLW